jgi:hypothetical protein
METGGLETVCEMDWSSRMVANIGFGLETVRAYIFPYFISPRRRKR